LRFWSGFNGPWLGDPKGVGDACLAASIRSLELFDTVEERGAFAAMVATISIEKHGAFDASLDDVLHRLGDEKEKSRSG
jgi:sugar/nucleoside kinase (ribokinase family)